MNDPERNAPQRNATLIDGAAGLTAHATATRARTIGIVD
jgi:hypothetical protein